MVATDAQPLLLGEVEVFPQAAIDASVVLALDQLQGSKTRMYVATMLYRSNISSCIDGGVTGQKLLCYCTFGVSQTQPVFTVEILSYVQYLTFNVGNRVDEIRQCWADDFWKFGQRNESKAIVSSESLEYTDRYCWPKPGTEPQNQLAECQ